MATRFAVGSGTVWSSTASWATTSGGSSGASVPTASDDVIFDSHSLNITLDVASCRSAVFTGYTGTLTHNAAVTWNIGTSTANGTTALTLVSTMTYTLGNAATSAINFVSTSATQLTILTGTRTLGNVTFNGVGGSWIQGDAIAATAATITHTNGTWATASFSVLCSTMAVATGTKTWTPGSSTVTISGGTTSTFVGTGYTVSANTAVMVMSNAGPGWSCNGSSINWNGMSLVFSGVINTSNNFSPNGGTLGNLVIVGTAVKTAVLSVNGANVTVTGTCAFQGNSATNRVLIQSGTLGTARTITCNTSTTASVTLAGTTYVSQWADFMDITGAGTASWDLTQAGAATATFGDCWGNSGGLSGAGTMTFTPAVPQTYTDSGVHSDNWSTLARWTSRVPLPQDNVSVPLGSTGTITVDMPRLGANVTFVGLTGTANFTTATTGFGNWTFGSGMTVSGSQNITLGGRGSQTVTHNGKSWPSAVIFNAVTGSYTMQDALQAGATGTSNCNPNTGSFSTGGFTVTCNQFIFNPSATLTITNSTILCNLSVAAGFFTVLSTGATVNATGSTIVLNSASTATRTFTTSGKTFGTLQYTVSGSPGPLVVTGTTPTFTNITVTTAGTAPKTLTLPSSTTTTVTGVFTITGTTVSGSIYLPGIAGSYISTPNAAWNQVTGDIDLRAKVALDSWSSVNTNDFVHKGNTTANTLAYAFGLNPTALVSGEGLLYLYWSTDGTLANRQTSQSTVAVGFSAGSQHWVRATLKVGAPWQVIFYTSNDGVIWTQLGATVNGAAGTSIAASTAIVEIGSTGAGTGNNLAGNVYSTQILNGIGGTVVSNVDFTTTATGLETSYTDAQANVWTVNGAVNSNVYLNSSTSGTKATISSSVDQFVGPNVVITDSIATATGGNVFVNLRNGTLSNTTGWAMGSLGTVTMAATGTLSVTALVKEQAAVALAAITTISTTALVKERAAVLLPATGSLSVAGVVTERAAVSLSATSGLSVSAFVTVKGAVVLSATSTMPIGATDTTFASVSMAATGTLTASGLTQRFGAVSMAADTSLTVSGVPRKIGVVSMTATATMTVSAAVTELSGITMTSVGTLVVPALVGVFGAVALSATGTLTATARLEITGAALMTAVSGMTIFVDLIAPPPPPPPPTPPFFPVVGPEPSRINPLLRKWVTMPDPVLTDGFPDPDLWVPTVHTAPTWAWQIIVNGVDMTFFRWKITKVVSFKTTEPFTEAEAEISFPQITGFDKLGEGDLTMFPGFDPATYITDEEVDVELWPINFDGSRPAPPWSPVPGALYEGYVNSYEWRNGYLTLLLNGCLLQEAEFVRAPGVDIAFLDIGAMIQEQYSHVARPSLRTQEMSFIPTGIKSRYRGGWEPPTEYIKKLLVDGITDAGRQWTVYKYHGRNPVLALKDEDTVQWSITYGTPGITEELQREPSLTPNVYYIEGEEGGSKWRNSFSVTPDGIFFQPAVYDTRVHNIDANPDGSLTTVGGRIVDLIHRKEVHYDFGSNISPAEARAIILKVYNRYKTIGFVGTITLEGVSPEEGDLRYMRAGHNLRYRYFQGSGAAGMKFHISAAEINEDPKKATLTVDTLARDIDLIQAIKDRKDVIAKSPLYGLQIGQDQGINVVSFVPWDSERSGYLPDDDTHGHYWTDHTRRLAIPGRTWTIVPVLTAERVNIFKFECHFDEPIAFHWSIYDRNLAAIIAEFGIAVTGLPTNPFAAPLGDPEHGIPLVSPWTDPKPSGYLIGWGQYHQRAGFYPYTEYDLTTGQPSGASPSGQFVDEGGFELNHDSAEQELVSDWSPAHHYIAFFTDTDATSHCWVKLSRGYVLTS